MQLPDQLRVILSGGGTGGHIFPAIAIANAIRELIPGAEILFIGANGRMEMEKVPAAGYTIKGLWISGLQRRVTFENVLVPLKIFLSMQKSRRILKKFKPDVVIGTGGYASGPTLKTAASLKIPTLIQEQNSYPGITNKLLAKNADLICVAFEEMEKFFPVDKILMTGNPVRQDIITTSQDRQKALASFGLIKDKPVLLVLGGSLGARTINHCIHSGLKLLVDNNIQVIWQTGKLYAPIAKQAVTSYNEQGIVTMPFISRMDLAFQAADIVISRAGAIAISELCVTGKPAILVPSPNVTGDHQTKNSMALKRKDAAFMVRDADAKALLIKKVIELARDPEQQAMLSENIKKLARPDAARVIAEAAISLALNTNTNIKRK